MTARSTPPHRVVARALALSVALFGVVRLEWVETHVLWPFTMLQARLAASGGAGDQALARVGLDCSGADAMALCLAFILAWPAGMARRLAGALGGLLFVGAVNVVRIVTLVRAYDSPWFGLLHEYVWPGVLTLASAGYVFAWVRRLDARGGETGTPPQAAAHPFGRFALVLAVSVAVFFATIPHYLESRPVLALAGWMASAAASLLGLLGAAASASGPVLTTSRGGFLVTGECIATPVIPLGIAAALALPRGWRARVLALAAWAPAVVALGLARLLVLALPPAVAGAPEIWVHAFFQVVLALAMVATAAAWTRGPDDRPRHPVARRALLACGLGIAVAFLLGWPYSQVVEAAAVTLAAPLVGGTAFDAAHDGQRALALLPPFQIGLFVALTIAITARWHARGLVAGAALLVSSQIALFAAIHGLAAAGWPAVPIAGLRMWAVAAPALVLFVMRSRANQRTAGGYLAFWERVGAEFPDLGGAASTDYYRDNEIRLLSDHLEPLDGMRLLKTDLWDEARNTRILQWAAGRGARPFGIDISRPTAAQAGRAFGPRRLHAAAADVRRLPFGDGRFTAVYSMGTIEHFADWGAALDEIFRVLEPGGRAIIGVPNRHDPFLRPLLVWLLQRAGLYAYGAERSFSRRQLRAELEARGFRVVAETGILFMPGWLRMLDLSCHAWCRPLTPVTRALVAPFAWLDRRFPALRRHGYLLATVVVKPSMPSSAS
jgi:exosortase/archaeosortase family protein